MSEPASERSHRERQVDALILEYEQADEQGRPLNQEEFLKQHAEYAGELREYLEDAGRIRDAVRPYRPEPEETEPVPGSAPETRKKGMTVRYFGDYEIQEELGSGGMGVVYKARQKKLKRLVALKMIKRGQFASEEDVKRFQAEAQAAAKLDHPGIVRVIEVGLHQGEHYYAMDYVAGGSLSALYREQPVAARRAADLVKKLAEAMHYAHSQDIVHRDLKPANVMLTTSGAPRITDFGLAMQIRSEGDSTGVNITQTGQVLGTAGYMSPEQAVGKTGTVGFRTDIYSLGAILYALLTSRAPFVGDSQADTIQQVLGTEPISPRTLNPRLPRDLETICLKCLEKEPDKRYGTAQLLAEDLQRFLENRPVLARPIGNLRRIVRWCRRRPSAATALGLMIVLAMGALVVARGDREALRRSKLQLFHTSVAQAKASRLSGRPGQRLDTLNAVRTGAGLIHELQLPAADTERLRGEAIGALTLLDLERKKLWQDELPLNTHVAVSDDFECFAYGAPAMDGVYIQKTSEPDGQAFKIATRITANSSNFTFAPGGRWFSVCDNVHLIHLLDRDRQTIVKTMPNSTGWLAMDWHPKLARVVHGNNLGELHCTDLENLQSTKLTGPGEKIAAIRFSPDGKQLAVCRKKGALEIIDSETGALIQSIASMGGWNRRVMAWHNDGQHLAVGDGRVIKIMALSLNAQSQNRPAEAGVCVGHKAGLMTLQFHPTYPILASASWDGTTRLWDAKTCEQLIRLPGEFCRFDRAGKRLALRCGRSLEYWELTLPELHRSIDGQTSKAVAIHPNGRIVAIAGLDGVRMWDLLTFAHAGTLPTDSPVDDVAFHPQTGDLMTAGSGGVREWPCAIVPQANDKCLRFGPPREVADGIGVASKIHWSRDGKVLLLAHTKSGTSYLLDWRTGTRSLQVLEQTGMHQMALSPDGNWTAAGNIKDANRITIWSTNTGKPVWELPVVGAPFVRFSPDGKWLAANTGRSTQLWSTTDWKLAHDITLDANAESAVAFPPDMRTVALSRWGGSIQVYDLLSAKFITSLNLISSPPLCVDIDFTADGEQMLVASDVSGTGVWDMQGIRVQLAGLGLGSQSLLEPDKTVSVPRGRIRVEVDLGEVGQSSP